MRKQYARLLSEYPPVVTLEQLYRICCISKRKGCWLLENGVIPCRDTGKKTHRFRIQLADVIRFMEDRNAGLTERKIPSGIFSNRRPYRKTALPPVDEQGFEAFFAGSGGLPDALTAGAVAKLLGYHTTAVNGWAAQKSSRQSIITGKQSLPGSI